MGLPGHKLTSNRVAAVGDQGAWDPWAELERRPHITFALRALPPATGGGIYARWSDGTAVLAIDPSMSREDQAAALTHELIHDERGGVPCEGSPDYEALEAQEEATVRRITALRLRRNLDQRRSKNPGRTEVNHEAAIPQAG